jgi:hypothetical protein
MMQESTPSAGYGRWVWEELLPALDRPHDREYVARWAETRARAMELAEVCVHCIANVLDMGHNL